MSDDRGFKRTTVATCRDCGWSNEAKNALATAAVHRNASGHTVDVEIKVTYNGDQVPAGQLAIEAPRDLYTNTVEDAAAYERLHR